MTSSGQRIRLWSGQGILVATAIALVWLIGAGLAPAQTASQEKPLLAEQVFKNVQVLKGIPVDEFMDTMGMFASALGYDCTSCHSPEVLQNREAFAVTTPQIQRARGMIGMMNTLNRTYFGGAPRVSCFTCHRGQDRPEIVPNLALQYGDVKDDPSLTFDDMGLDSLAFVEIQLAMEQEYGITVGDEDAESIHTVGEAIDFVNRQLAEQV